jgi:hypothetical protein
MSPVYRLALIPAVALAAFGCGPTQPTAAPTAAEPVKSRSPLFLALEGEPKAGKLKDRFSAKFPTYTFQVVATERTAAHGGSVVDSPKGLVGVHVSLVVKNPGPKFDDEVGPLFDELQAYLEEQVAATGMELNGPVEQFERSRKSGFVLKYRSATHRGGVTVDRPQYVPGGFALKLYEAE